VADGLKHEHEGEFLAYRWGGWCGQAWDETSISLTAGCNLFLRYVTRTSAVEYEDIAAGKARLIERGERFGEISQKVLPSHKLMRWIEAVFYAVPIWLFFHHLSMPDHMLLLCYYDIEELVISGT
jgi:hypothetical protein